MGLFDSFKKKAEDTAAKVENKTEEKVAAVEAAAKAKEEQIAAKAKEKVAAAKAKEEQLAAEAAAKKQEAIE